MKYEEPYVVVMMAVYKPNLDYLNAAITSILSQEYSNYRLYIVNDGGESIQKKIPKDSKIVLYERSNNMGLAYSLNEIFNMEPNADYYARMDADDIADKRRIIHQVTFMEKQINIDICGMYAKKVGDEGDLMAPTWNKSCEIFIQLLYSNPLIHSTIMFRGDSVRKLDLRYNPDFTYAQDFELWTRIAINVKFYILPIIGGEYRVHNNQISIRSRKEQDYFKKKCIVRNLAKYGLDIGMNEYLSALSGELDNMLTIKNICEFADFIIVRCFDKEKHLKKRAFCILSTRIISLYFSRISIGDVIKDGEVRKYFINKYFFYWSGRYLLNRLNVLISNGLKKLTFV